MIKLLKYSLLTIMFLGTGILYAQEEVKLNNGSFEDFPRQGTINTFGLRTPAPIGWFDCGAINFPFHTPPDVHPNEDSPYWGVSIAPSEGETFLGLVVRGDESWESVSQNISAELKAGQCYSFSIDLLRSPDYWSQIRNDGSEELKSIIGQKEEGQLHNHITPAVLRVWGGKTYCVEGELLASSSPVENAKWKRYTFKIRPTFNVSHITLEAFYNVPVIAPYLGHVLVDNASSFVPIDCNDPLEEERIEDIQFEELVDDLPIAEEEQAEEEKIIAVAKQKVPSKTPTGTASINDKPKKTVKKKEKILTDLDRKKLKKGQLIQIKNLQFQADNYVVDSSSFDVIFEIYEFLKLNRDVEIEIGGHTNGVPPHSYCDQLSQNRAQAVADVLVYKGIDKERVRVKGYGKRQPKYSNKTPLGRKKNQRVEIKILKLG